MANAAVIHSFTAVVPKRSVTQITKKYYTGQCSGCEKYVFCAKALDVMRMRPDLEWDENVF